MAGSPTTGDHRPGVSDLDLVAWVDRAPDRDALSALHRRLDGGPGMDAGDATLADPTAPCGTWTHGALVDRTVSRVTRAELVRHGWAELGPEPARAPERLRQLLRRRRAGEEVGWPRRQGAWPAGGSDARAQPWAPSERQ